MREADCIVESDGGLHSGWRIVRLGDACRTTSGGTPSRKRPEFFDGTIPWVKSGELTDGLVLDVEERITEDAVANSSAKVFPAGTLLIAMYGATVGKLGVLARPAATNQAVCAVFPNEGIDSKFLFWFLRFQRATLVEKAVGGAQPNISQAILRDLPVPVPPGDVQRRIVAEIDKQFSRLDEAVANLQRVKANLKRYKAAVLKAAVEGRLVETEASIARREGRGYETGEQLLQRILDERRKQWVGRGKYKPPQLPTDTDAALPEGWVWASIDQLAEVGTGATPSRSNPAFWTGGDIPWVSSSVVNADQVTEATEFVTERALAETNLTLYPPGTLLLAMYGEGKTRGKCTELRIHATTNQALAALQASAYVRGYLRLFLEHNYEEMRKVASGGVQPNLNLSLVRSVCAPMPPAAEQVRISAEIDRQLTILRGVEAEVDFNLQRAQALRQSVLVKVFSRDSHQIQTRHITTDT